MRVLIAEDSAMTRLMLRRAVESLGHECLVAEDGTAAWELFQERGPDVIISDWLMPGIEGPELCRRVREHARTAASNSHPAYTYFVLLTVLEDKQHALEGMEAGADDYLAKPPDLDELRLRLIAASRVTGLHRQLAERDAERERAFARREVLLRLARQFAAESNVEQLLTDLLTGAVAVVGGEGGALLRWDEARAVLVPVRNTIPDSAPDTTLPLGHGASGRAAATRAPVILNDYQREVSEETPGRRSGIQAAVGTPLLDEGRLLGALAVMSRDAATRFTAEDAQTLEILASVGAAALVALERARLDGVLLAARTAQHELNNRLTLTTGFAELLQRDPALPPHLREAAGQAYYGAKAAASILQQLQKLTHLEETDWGPSLHPTIDLAGSTNVGIPSGIPPHPAIRPDGG
jgi:DNA-binding response OmpR family regulator